MIAIAPNMDNNDHNYELSSGTRHPKEKYKLYISCKTRPIITKNSIKLTLNLVCRGETTLSRLDIGGTHTNPKEKQLPENSTLRSLLKDYPKKKFSRKEPHIHLYTSNLGDAWAVPAEKLINITGNNLTNTFKNYLRYSNVNLNVCSELSSLISCREFHQMKL